MAKKKGQGQSEERRREMAGKLVELGTKRVRKLLKAIKIVGNLGRYKPSAAQTNAVFTEIAKHLTVAQRRWQGATEESGPEFSLPA